jgi:hypothetical protein
MTHTPDRRRDPQLRTAIDEYRELAARLKTEAANCKDPVQREKHRALAKSLTELADAFQGRPSISN